MKLFILTHCAAEENYTPSAHLNLRDAQAELNRQVNRCVDSVIGGNGDDETLTREEAIDCYFDVYEVHETSAVLVYTDETYDVFEIFEVEMPEQKSTNETLYENGIPQY